MHDTVNDARSDAANSSGRLHLLLCVQKQLVAVPTDTVREILMAPRTSRIPGAPAQVRGVANIRGEVMPVVDLRVRLGLPPNADETRELVNLLEARKADHLRWIGELEACVRENREFELARDPRMCAFGRWYASYRPDNLALQMVWDAFDAPHRAIHALADEVLARATRGDAAGALAAIEATRSTTLERLVALFAQAVAGVKTGTRELAVVLESGARRVAVVVDGAEAVEILKDGDLSAVPDTFDATARESLAAIARRSENPSDLVLVLHVEPLFEAGEVRAAA